jgi:hypothetical protein
MIGVTAQVLSGNGYSLQNYLRQEIPGNFLTSHEGKIRLNLGKKNRCPEYFPGDNSLQAVVSWRGLRHLAG